MDKDFPFQFLTAQSCATDARTPVIERQDYEACTIEYVLKGRGFLEVNGESFTVETDSIYFLPKHSNHRYWPDPADPWTKLFVVFDGPLMEELFRIYGMDRVYCLPDARSLRPFFESMLHMNRSLPRFRLHQRASVWFHEFLENCSAMLRQDAELCSGSIRRLKEELDTKIHERFVLSDYCRNAGLSTAYAIRAFRAAFGTTPMEYLLSLKMEEAQRLLQYSMLSVKEIAALLEFSSQYHFSNCFRNRLGESPRSWRKGRQTRIL